MLRVVLTSERASKQLRKPILGTCVLLGTAFPPMSKFMMHCRIIDGVAKLLLNYIPYFFG